MENRKPKIKGNIKIHLKKLATKSKPTIGIQEPSRKTMYDNLVENLKVAGRKTFIHRIIYFGKHNFEKESEMDPIIIFFRNVINKANDDYFAFEKLTGFLLYYATHFIHVVEGDEDTINRHIKILYCPENIHHFQKIKLLGHISHINERLLTDWTYYFGIPRKHAIGLNTEMSVKDIGAHVYSCINKVFKLITEIQNASLSATEMSLSLPAESNMSFKKQSSREKLGLGSFIGSMSGSTSVVDTVRKNPLTFFLPEVDLLELFLKFDFPVDLKYFESSYGVIPQRDIYKDKVWPVPTDFIPYDVFDTSYKTVTSFPKPKDFTISKPKAEVEESVVDDREIQPEEKSLKESEEEEIEMDEGFGSTPDVEKF